MNTKHSKACWEAAETVIEELHSEYWKNDPMPVVGRAEDGRAIVRLYDDSLALHVRMTVDAWDDGLLEFLRVFANDIPTTFDIVVKPHLKPIKATPARDRDFLPNRRRHRNHRNQRNQRLHDESPEQFAKRVQRAICLDPEKYFRRIEVPGSDVALGGRIRFAADVACAHCGKSHLGKSSVSKAAALKSALLEVELCAGLHAIVME